MSSFFFLMILAELSRSNKIPGYRPKYVSYALEKLAWNVSNKINLFDLISNIFYKIIKKVQFNKNIILQLAYFVIIIFRDK